MTDSADDTWTSPSPPPQPATDAGPAVLAGRYELHTRIAIGGMATVWRAVDDVLAREVAVKVLHEHLAADEAFRERFRREAVSAAKLTHPNVVGLYDTGRDGDHTFLVMELVEGPTLKDLLADGPLPVGQAARVGVQVARALAYAHARGLVHRDVKPANILITADGTVKVTDFGIAKADQADDLTSTGTVLGTAAYVAPEQIRGETVTGAADQYSLGVVLYEALTGEQPFQGDSPLATAAQRLEHDPRPVRDLRPQVPRGLDGALQRAVAREPGDRHPDLAAFADALAHHADIESGDEMAVSTEPPPDAGGDRTPASPADAGAAPAPARRRLRRALAALAAVGVVGVGLWVTVDVGDVVDGLPFGAQSEEAEPVTPANVTIYDPQGTGSEREGDLPNLLDGDAETTWRTQHYEGAAFGGLKEGVGFVIELEQAAYVEEVLLRSTFDGVDVELRAAEGIAPEPDDWRTLDRVEDGSDVITLEPVESVRTEHLLVWITGELPASPLSRGRFAAEFSQVAVMARPES